MVNTKVIRSTLELERDISHLIYICSLGLFLLFIEFSFYTPMGKSMNSTVWIICFLLMIIFIAAFPTLRSKYLLNKRSNFMEEHSDLVKDVWSYDAEQCILVLYDGDNLKEALKNKAYLSMNVRLNPKWEEMIEESEKKKSDEENKNG